MFEKKKLINNLEPLILHFARLGSFRVLFAAIIIRVPYVPSHSKSQGLVDET